MEATWAAIGALVTAVALKLADYILSRGQERRIARKSLLEEVDALWERIDELENAVEKFRTRCLDLEGENRALRFDLASLTHQVNGGAKP